MIVIHQIKFDLQAPGIMPSVNAVQLDSNTRVIKAFLYSGGVPLSLDSSAEVSLACIKPDRTKCWYDKLPDGNAAASVDGNTVSITLAPEVLTVAGLVTATIVIRNGISDQISAFPFSICVADNPATGCVISNDYYKIASLDALNTWISEFEEKYADVPSAGGAVDDVQVNGESIISNGVANIPLATSSQYGVVKTLRDYGITSYNVDGKPVLGVRTIDGDGIDNRERYKPISGAELDYAVKAAMCDGKGDAWTDAEQAAARKRIGVNADDWVLVEEISIDEEAVVERRYEEHYKKIVIIARNDDSKLPKIRLLGNANFWEFYGYAADTYACLNVYGEITIPKVFSQAYTLYGEAGGNATQAWPIMGRLTQPTEYFDGFKTDSACHVGTKIKVYGVKTA